MELKSIIFIAAVLLITACAKESVQETADCSHEIVVSIADLQVDTKCTVDEGGKTSFSLGDEILVVAANSGKATYTYKSKQSGEGGEKYVFQKNFNEVIDTNKILAAYYPASMCSYNFSKNTLSVEFPTNQTYTQNGTQIISAPMAASYDNVDKKLVFSNLCCLLKIGIGCSTEPDAVIKIQKINVTPTSEDNCLSGPYRFSGDNIINKGDSEPISLDGCESAGAISTDVKYFYIFLPPIFNSDSYEDNDVFTITVFLTNGKSFEDTFTAIKGVKNSIEKNIILNFDPFIISQSGDTLIVGH